MSENAAQENRERVLQFVRTSVELLTARLRTELPDLSAELVEELAKACVHDITHLHGGSYMYIPKDLGLDLSKRDYRIFDEFDGSNVHELAKRYGLTPMWIRTILAKVKTARLRASQGQLPGFGDGDGT